VEPAFLCADEYAWAIEGSDICPTGFVPIADRTLCQRIATAEGKTFAGAVGFFYQYVASGDCYSIGSKVYFDPHQTDASASSSGKQLLCVKPNTGTACGPGTFSTTGAATCSLAPAGTFTGKSPSNTDTDIQGCGVLGYYCPEGSRSSWGETLNLSTTNSSSRSIMKHPCPPGTIGLKANATSEADCTQCSAGTFNDEPGSSGECSLCPLGFVCPPGSSSRTYRPCPEGKFLNRTGGASESECFHCPNGRWSETNTTSMSGCGPCPIGHYCNEGGKHPCEPGTYKDGTGGESLESCTKCPAGTYNDRSGQGHPAACKSCPPGQISLMGSRTEGACLPAAKLMPDTLEVKVSPDKEENFIRSRVLLVNILARPMTWTFSFPSSSVNDSWYTVAALQNETDVPATRYSPASTGFSGQLERFQFFDIIVFAVKDLSELPIAKQTERRCFIKVSFVNENGITIDLSLPLDVKVTQIAGRASPTHSVLSATVCSSFPPNCTSISATEPLTVPIPAFTEMRWTLSTRDTLGHSRDKSDGAKVTMRCKDQAGNEYNGTDSAPYGACLIKDAHDERDGNYTCVLIPIRTGKLTVIATIGAQKVFESTHTTFEVSKPVCPPQITVLSEAEADIRIPCICAIGTKRLVAGSTGSPQCELCPQGTFTLEKGAPECQECPKDKARCFSGAEVMNAAGFWLDLQCIATGIEQMTLSKKNVFDKCPFMKCPKGPSACSEPNRTSVLASELSKLYLLLPTEAAGDTSQKLLARSSACPPDKCPLDAPWLMAASLNCYREQANSDYIYCPMAASASISQHMSATLPRLNDLQCNEGYEGRLCASCSKGYGLQVRSERALSLRLLPTRLFLWHLPVLHAGRRLPEMPRCHDELGSYHPCRAVRHISAWRPDVDHSQRRWSKKLRFASHIPHTPMLRRWRASIASCCAGREEDRADDDKDATVALADCWSLRR
jgi:hypothetical protein